MSYPNIIVNPAILRPMGQIGWALWYALEMETRYAYYLLKFSDRINFVETRLEEATTPQGATRLLAAEIRSLLNRMRFDPVALASDYIKSGKSLSAPAAQNALAA